jgi:hypothetical protein
MIDQSIPSALAEEEQNESVETRPLDSLSVPKTAAQKALADQLVERYGFDPAAAAAVARDAVDPQQARNQLQFPYVRRFPGGTATFLLFQTWTPAHIPGLTNPRVADARVYPASVGPGQQPLLPLRASSAPSGRPGLLIEAKGREQVERTIRQSENYLRQNRDLRDQIAIDGILEPVILVATELRHADGTPTVWVPMAVDGSTRTSHAHELAGFDTVSVLYDLPQLGAREWREKLQPIIDVQRRPVDEVSEQELVRHRALTMPALLLLKVTPVAGAPPVSIMDAVRALVGAIHVRHPSDWTERSRFGEVADTVLEHLLTSNALDGGERELQYLAGLVSHADLVEARAAGTMIGGRDGEPDERAAKIAELLLGPGHRRAVHRGVRAYANRKAVRATDRAKVATQLLMRGFPRAESARDDDGVRSVLERTLEMSEFASTDWHVESLTPDELLDAALNDLEATANITSAQLQLGAQALIYLVRSEVPVESGAPTRREREFAFRRDKATDEDKRQPSVVLRELLRSEHGLRQLHRAILDGRAGVSIRLISPEGKVKRDARLAEMVLSNEELRNIAKPKSNTVGVDAGKAGGTMAQSSEAEARKTASERVMNRVAKVLGLAGEVEGLVREIGEVRDVSGGSYIVRRGLHPAYVGDITAKLRAAADKMAGWGALYDATQSIDGGEDDGTDGIDAGPGGAQ